MKSLIMFVLLSFIAYCAYVILSDNKTTKPFVDKAVIQIKDVTGIEQKPTTSTHCALRFIDPLPDEQNISSISSVEVIVDNSNKGCHWGVFEAQAGTVSLFSDKGVLLAKSILKTSSDWMTSSPVTYKAGFSYKTSTYTGPIRIKFVEESASDDVFPETAYMTVFQN